MATYESIIGSGTDANYLNVGIWWANERTAPSEGGSYADGDTVIAKLQNADDGHTGTHPLEYSTGSTDDFAAVDLTIIVSGTNPDRSEWSSPCCTLNLTPYINSNSSSKTYKFENLDIYMDLNRTWRCNFFVNESTTGSSFDIEFENCRIYCPSSGSHIEAVRNYLNSSACVFTTKLENCQVIPNRYFYRVGTPAGGLSAIEIHKSIGSTFYINDANGYIDTCIYRVAIDYSPSLPFSGSLEVHTSGCLCEIDPTNGGFFVYRPSITGPLVNYTSGTAIDFITSEAAAEFTAWADTRINASSDITFNFGTAPAANEVSFASAYNATTPNLTLYDDSNNLAIGFVSNVTLPSTDLVGNSRGASPYDAGAFAIVDEDFQFGATVIQVGYRRSNNRLNIEGGVE